MSRLIDADKQLEWVECMTPIHGIGLEPVVAVETVRDLIKSTPTIDAIPVEWLEQQFYDNPKSQWAEKCRDVYTKWQKWQRWQKEQGAR